MFNKTNSPKTTAPDPAKKVPQRTTPNAAPSIFGRDLVVTGDIKSDGEIQIDGRHEGNVTAARITVGEHGAINGTVKAKAIYIRGKITGKINAGLVELAETANVQADIIQEKITVANGAFFDGKCSRRAQTTANVVQKPRAQTTKVAAAKK